MTTQLQTNPGGYASELISDRFQIMSSVIGDTFYVCDLEATDMVFRGTDGLICRFNSIEEAKNFVLTFTSHADPATTDPSTKEYRRKQMIVTATARAMKELNAARKAAKSADAQLDKKDTDMVPAKASKKITALRASAAPAKKAAADKVVNLKPGKNVLPRRTDGEGSGAYIRRLLVAGHLDTDAILEAVHAQFPGSKAKASDVAWNKGKLKKDGVTLPSKAA
jgi:hypothetical protein